MTEIFFIFEIERNKITLIGVAIIEFCVGNPLFNRAQRGRWGDRSKILDFFFATFFSIKEKESRNLDRKARKQPIIKLTINLTT